MDYNYRANSRQVEKRSDDRYPSKEVDGDRKESAEND
jgi:hypothetical protein